MRYFKIDPTDIHEKIARITGEEVKHLKNVLRIKPGDTVGLLDGTGNVYEGAVITITPDSVEVAVETTRPATTESPIRITVAQGYLKDSKLDDLIRPLTELGISEYFPFLARYSIPRPNDKRTSHQLERRRKIAAEAVKQCKRGVIPHIGSPISFHEAVEKAQGHDLKILFWEKQGEPLKSIACSRQDNDPVESVFIMLGPEGGLTETEVETAASKGFIIATLGPRILRSETAAVAACTLVQYLFGDMSV